MSWMGLNQHLIAEFWEVNRDGSRKGDAVVKAPLSEASMDVTLNWQSAFENVGPESKSPALMSLLQQGYLTHVVGNSGINGNVGGMNPMQQLIAGAGAALGDAIKEAEGRMSITKLNSTQVFSGMPPVKFAVTAVFRAWADARSEVEEPFNQLMKWALPIDLSEDGMVVQGLRAATGASALPSAIQMLMPSQAPTIITMKYKNRVYKPLVIEAISQPLSSPIDGDGRFMQLLVPMTICSLAAIDRADWDLWESGQ